MCCLFSAACSKCDVYFLLEFVQCLFSGVCSLLSVWCYSQFTQLKCPLIVLSTTFEFEYLKFNVTLKSSYCFSTCEFRFKSRKTTKILQNIFKYTVQRLQDVNSLRKANIGTTHIYKTILINCNTKRIKKLTIGGHKLSTRVKH